MPRVLTSFQTFHWAAAFALLSMACVMGGDGAVLRMAFASAALLISLLMICGSVNFVAGVYPAVAVHMEALLASYPVVQAERLAAMMSVSPNQGDVRAAARFMALGAAHVSTLSRISGRADANFLGGGR